MRSTIQSFLFVTLLLSPAAALAVPPPARGPAILPGRGRPVKEVTVFGQFNQAEIAFVGKLTAVQAGPVAQSFPPIYTFQLTFADEPEMLRGAAPQELVFHYSKRTTDKPTFDIDTKYVIAASRPDQKQKNFSIGHLLPATKENLATARSAASLPLGWKLQEGKPVSPWAARGDKAWPGVSDLSAKNVCGKSGRPALLAGADIKIVVEQVPPEKLQKFKNPYGDGKFKVTVTNTSKMAVSVPALLKKGDDVNWADSLVIISRDKTYLLPSADRLIDAKPVELGPGESITATVDLLTLDGVPWPRGGSRVHFTFCLGEKAASNFFYYYSDLHDKMRNER